MLSRFLKNPQIDTYAQFVSDYALKMPEHFNFAFDVVDEYARQEPDKTAMVWCDMHGDEAKFSFADMAQRSAQNANFFASLGIERGDRVMVMLKRRYEYWFTVLGLHKLGAVVIPATHLLTKKDIAYRNNAADIKMIVAYAETPLMTAVEEAMPDSTRKPLLVSVGCERPGWVCYEKGVAGQSTTFDRIATNNSDLFLLYFTSGTTGMPKMVAHDFTYPLAHISTAKYWQQVRDGGLHLTVAETGWAKAAWGKLYGQWLCGCAVFVYDFDRFVAHELMSVMAKHHVTSFCAPPTIYRFMIKEDLSAYDLSALEHISVAGEPLNPEVYNQIQQKLGLKLMECYGQTELVTTLGNYCDMQPKPGSMGKPNPIFDVAVIDDEGNVCEVGDEGEIVVRNRPVGMFLGYHNDDELTGAAFAGGVYHTGDMAWVDEDGYFWFVGRADDVIKSSGYRIGPFEVESALMEHPAVLECAVTGLPDPDRGAVVKATVVLAKGYEGSDELIKTLQNHVKKVTAPYKYPRVVEFVSEMPKTISGKIRRTAIRAKDTDKANSGN